MTAALAQRTDAPAAPKDRRSTHRASLSLSRTPTAPPAAAEAAVPIAPRPRLAPVPECEPPLDPEPWQGPSARPAFGIHRLWPDRPSQHAASGGVTPPASAALRRSTPGGAAAEEARAAAARPVRTATSSRPSGALAPANPPPPMTHRRWSQPPAPLAQRAAPDQLPGRATPPPVSPESHGTAPGRARVAGAISAGGSAQQRPPTPGTRPVYSASGAITQPEEEYADLQPVEIVAHRHERVATRPPAPDAATLLARALVEVLAGRRPPAQLRPHCTDGVYHALGDFPRLGPRPSLTSMWVCEPTRERAEVSASFRCGGMTRALAMRLDSADQHWQITALQLA